MNFLKYTVGYRDLSCSLSQYDVDSVSGWLSDNIIQFFGELLENNFQTANSRLNINFIHPIASNFLRQNPKAVLDYLKFTENDWILCPVHDANEYHKQGSHWSLLVISVNLKMSLYLDSMLPNRECNSTQLQCAKQNNEIICSYFNWDNEFRIIPCVQQNDYSSCGVYVIFNMLCICNFLSKDDLSWIDHGIYDTWVLEPPKILRSILQVEVDKYLRDREQN
nr:sentrin specific protease 8 [Hymenolepis microstoma]